MAKVKIQGNASGTGVLTVTAPNTSTDRTITLPDSTGTLLNSDGSGANLTNLPATTSITTTNSSDTVFDHALKVNNSRGSNDSFVSLGFHNRADVNTTGIKGALVFDGTGKSDGIGDFVFCNSTTANIATAVTPSDERVRIQSGGGISFNGDTAAANALDDYEEGTWTMALTCGSGSVTQSNAAGNYTKIGRQVTLTGYADVASISSPSGLLTIGGIPFNNVSNGTGFYTAVAVQGSNWVSSVTDLYGSLSGNNLYIFGFSSGNQTAVADKLQVGSAININVSYFTAA